jgi:hypothetical protein
MTLCEMKSLWSVQLRVYVVRIWGNGGCGEVQLEGVNETSENINQC